LADARRDRDQNLAALRRRLGHYSAGVKRAAPEITRRHPPTLGQHHETLAHEMSISGSTRRDVRSVTTAVPPQCAEIGIPTGAVRS
jgi:hypothetical protein